MKAIITAALATVLFTACTSNAKTSDKLADRCVMLVHSAEYPVLKAQMRHHSLIMEEQAALLEVE